MGDEKYVKILNEFLMQMNSTSVFIQKEEINELNGD